jgi:hypothetical protein
MKYYVYLYIDPFNKTPFYVGKGCNNRSKHHLNVAKSNNWGQDPNKLKINKIRKIISKGIDPIIEIKEMNLSESEAFEREKFYISKYGRIDIGTGILTNLSDGGDGQRNWIPSKEYCENMSKSCSREKNGMFGKKQKEDTKEKMKEKAMGRKHSEKIRNEMSESRKKEKNSFYGKKHTKDSLDKISENRKGKCTGKDNCSAKCFIFTSPSGKSFEVNGEFSKFCDQNNISEGRMKRFIGKGEIPECNNHHTNTQKTINCKGWKVKMKMFIEKTKTDGNPSVEKSKTYTYRGYCYSY